VAFSNVNGDVPCTYLQTRIKDAWNVGVWGPIVYTTLLEECCSLRSLTLEFLYLHAYVDPLK
jgi:hypothetical protein